ncbi:MAG TPA: ABC transporter permease [Gaiellaceae bacterium]|jgi:ABC-2 type transport system permease protein|nr:ABC transporter permease [Gaiellaceae bacterium]
MSSARIFWTGFVLHFKNLSASPFMVVAAAVWPLVYATLAFLMFRATDEAPSLLYAALGAAVMGIWSTTATSAGGAIQQQRWYGVLELLVAAPSRLILVLAPVTVAISGIGVYSIASTLLWGKFLFGVPLHIEHLLLFAISIPAAVLSIGLLGLVLASTLVLYRSASSLSQALEYPIWTITGMLIPLSLLPGWVTPIAWVLAPTWGMRAVRHSALGGNVVFPLDMCLLLSLAYAAISVVFLHHFERLARDRATLSLT